MYIRVLAVKNMLFSICSGRIAVRTRTEKEVTIGEVMVTNWSQIPPPVSSVAARAGKLVAMMFTCHGAAPAAARGITSQMFIYVIGYELPQDTEVLAQRSGS
jgi:hypothetical protein